VARLVFGMNVSLDGFVDHDVFEPDPVLFDHFIEQTRNSSGSIYGRGLYEIMSYWDGDDWDQHEADNGALVSFAEAWRRMPKWVVSQSLSSVGPNATLVNEDPETAIRRLKTDVDGEIEVKFQEPGAIVPALEVFDAVGTGAVVAGWSTPGYWAGRVPALQLLAAVPFGPQAGEYLAWVKFGGGKELFDELYEPHNIKSLHCAIIAPSFWRVVTSSRRWSWARSTRPNSPCLRSTSTSGSTRSPTSIISPAGTSNRPFLT